MVYSGQGCSYAPLREGVPGSAPGGWWQEVKDLPWGSARRGP